MKRGGGWAAIWYSLRMASRVGWWRLWRAMTRKNACKTCALGMGGQAGGMRNEAGHWPEVCKKSFQAMIADMQEGISPDFFARWSIAQLQTLSSRELESSGRLALPVHAGPNDRCFKPISWDAALGKIAARLRESLPDECFFYASGRSSNEAGFVLQLFARVFGTNFVNNCSYYCHQASGVGLGQALGTGTATVTLGDVEDADLFFLIGGNPASNHPRLMRSLMTIRRRGGHVIVINPAREVGLVNFSVPSDLRSLLFGSPIATHYVQPHIGGDIPLLLGLAKILLERGAVDLPFIEKHTDGFAAYRQQAVETTWEEIERTSGVQRQTIAALAERYQKAQRVIFGWTMGITHHEHGVDNVRAIVNTALLRGMVGRPGAGLLPIRGHSNVQGMGSVGVAPNLKEHVLGNLERILGAPLPRTPGLDTMGCMHAADAGRMRFALCLGGNLFGSNPDARAAQRALGRVDLVTYLSTTLNTGHVWGRGQETVILPVLARDEEPQRTTQESMFNFVRLSDGGPARLRGPRAETDILADIAERVLGSRGPIRWDHLRDHCTIRHMIARAIPGFQGLASIDATRTEFQIPGRTFAQPRFNTPDGKACFAAPPIPRLGLADDELRLMTVRSEGQFNTVVYEEEDIYRGQERRDVILMHEDDIHRLGLRIDNQATVTSAAGRLDGVLVRAFDIRPGNALMYFPEANVLVPRTVDPQSKTPAFKSVVVRVTQNNRRTDDHKDGNLPAIPPRP